MRTNPEKQFLSCCFDIFTDPTGQRIPADSKSVAYRIHYSESTRTLKTEEIDTAHQKVIEALTKGLGVKFRLDRTDRFGSGSGKAI